MSVTGVSLEVVALDRRLGRVNLQLKVQVD